MVEIGPGLGAITRPLLARLKHLHVVEIDRDIISACAANSARPNSPSTKATPWLDFASVGTPMKIVGNLPYNISTRCCSTWLNTAIKSPTCTSCCKRSGGPHGGRAGHRRLRPAVGDAAIPFFHGAHPGCAAGIVQPAAQGGFRRGAHDPYDTLPHRAQDEALLAHIVQVAFAQRRKTLRNNLKGVLDDDGFTALDIDPGIRPENLSVGGFVAIANYLSKKV